MSKALGAISKARIAAAKEAGVSGALIVQPANHMFDHSYTRLLLTTHRT